MFEQLTFEAEPFAFEADYESPAGGTKPSPPPAPVGMPACEPAKLKTPKPPKGLVLLPHFHVSKSLPGGSASAAPQCMEPAGMNPGFVDPNKDELVTNPATTGLDARFKALIASKHKARANVIGAALVDLTGPRLFAPELAGYRSTWNVYGASLPKICAIYAARQLGFELHTFASRHKFTTKKALVDHVRALWDKAGLARAQQPNLDETFDYKEAAPKAVVVTPSARLEKIISCTVSNCNRAASLLIDRVGLAYIGSLHWQSGLYHPKRGGLWLSGLYGDGCEGCTEECCHRTLKLVKAHAPVYVQPSGGVHNTTALSAVTCFTLMAQGRLGDYATSVQIRNDLAPACSEFLEGDLACTTFQTPTKCGAWNGYYHDVALVERNIGAGCTGKVIRYAVALMTHNAFPSTNVKGQVFQQFIRDADALIQQNNP